MPRFLIPPSIEIRRRADASMLLALKDLRRRRGAARSKASSLLAPLSFPPEEYPPEVYPPRSADVYPPSLSDALEWYALPPRLLPSLASSPSMLNACSTCL